VLIGTQLLISQPTRAEATELRAAARVLRCGALSPAADSPTSTGAPPGDRAGYPHWLAIPTRWKDNDVYGHVNNTEYYSYFDTVINAYLIEQGGLDIHAGETIGLCVESHCAYRAALAFPETVDAGLRVGHLGRSSVRYEIGIFRRDEQEPAATGWFVHVFVDRAARRPAEMPPQLRAALERLAVSA
jgi:acyl-CoA thioester hydrolase